MTRATWRLRRLRAMSAAEILARARAALRDRFAPPEYARLSPTSAAARLFPGGEPLAGTRLAAFGRVPEARAEFAPVLEAAGELAAGRWNLFGRAVTLADPPRWNRNPLSGAEWPDAPAAALDHRRADLAGGAKFTWEQGRLTFLPTLALAARLSGDDAPAREALRWLEDWTLRNPLGHGIHQTSGIEMAVRAITVSRALALLGAGDARPAGEVSAGAPAPGAAVALLAQQALWCRDHLSLGSSANNHLIAEYAGMTVVGSLVPALDGAAALARAGLAGLEREALRQIHPDGVPAEQAFGYLPFVWELLLNGFLAGEVAGFTVTPPVRDRLVASLEFARSIRLPDGRWPQVGDEDDGRVLLAIEAWSRLDLVGNALAAWLGAPALADDAAAMALLLTGRAPGPARAPEAGRREFPAGGYSIWREGDLLVTFDHGPLGLGTLAAHGHADALAITIFAGATPIVIDPGTWAYQEDPEGRDRFRGTPAHATVSFGARNQSELLGPFLWGARARVSPAGDGWECRWATGERHRRSVAVTGRTVTVADAVEGREPALVFPLPAGAQVEIDGAVARVAIGPTRATFTAEGTGAWRVETGEVSPRYATRVAAPRLVAAISGASCRTVIEVG